jgi:hypothetical protein
VSINGSMNKAKATWNATIRNTSQTKIFRVTFCVKAFDSSDQEIKPGGNECVIRLWGSNWEPGAPLTADSGGWRSAFRTDVDHDSEVMPISVPN